MAHGESEEGGGSGRSLGLAPPNINVTPLIDVLLVLLIIFMVIQPQKEAKFESNIPQKPQEDDKNAPVPPSDMLMVDVKLQGSGPDQTIELNSRPMTLVELGTTLKDLLEQRPDKTVFIKAPKDKQYGDIVNVIDVVKGAGAQPIGLQIDYLQ
ncbi:MAG TPA: biopolymer transporter ExbD [Blastocatellia bacterium]|nr:biopolymer transporter ExbD [Blastocatellia bacterium]